MICDSKNAIQKAPKSEQEQLRSIITKEINKIIQQQSYKSTMNLEQKIKKSINRKLQNENMITTKADKSKAIILTA